jgi:hypothetical protein
MLSAAVVYCLKKSWPRQPGLQKGCRQQQGRLEQGNKRLLLLIVMMMNVKMSSVAKKHS